MKAKRQRRRFGCDCFQGDSLDGQIAHRLLMSIPNCHGLAKLMLISGLTAIATDAAPQQATESNKFEAAFIRRFKAANPGRGGDIRLSPGRLSVICEALASLIPRAYLTNAERRVTNDHFIRILGQPLRGAPSWGSTDLYQIEASR